MVEKRFQGLIEEQRLNTERIMADTRSKMNEMNQKVQRQLSKPSEWWRSKFDLVNTCLLAITASSIITAGCALYLVYKFSRR